MAIFPGDTSTPLGMKLPSGSEYYTEDQYGNRNYNMSMLEDYVETVLARDVSLKSISHSMGTVFYEDIGPLYPESATERDIVLNPELEYIDQTPEVEPTLIRHGVTAVPAVVGATAPAIRTALPELVKKLAPTVGAITGGAIVGGAVTGGDGMVGLPGGEYQFGDILPGGAPARVPDLPENRIVKMWYTGTTVFAIDSDGKHWVAKKVRRTGQPDTYTWKKYRPGGAIVIGKELTPKNMNKALRALKKFKKVADAYNKAFPKRRKCTRKHA